MEQQVDFNAWLQQVGEILGLPSGEEPDRVAWRWYYTRDYSPQGAVDEDMGEA